MAEAINARLITLLKKNAVSGAQIRDLDKEVSGWTSEEVTALLRLGLIQTLMQHIDSASSSWEIVYRVLQRTSHERNARAAALKGGLLEHLGNAVLVGARKAKREKQISILLAKSRALAALSTDAPDSGLVWVEPLCCILNEALTKAVAKSAFTDAYVLLSLVRVSFCKFG
jgi:hypothetical protein